MLPLFGEEAVVFRLGIGAKNMINIVEVVDKFSTLGISKQPVAKQFRKEKIELG